jgi:hypothetical protein
LIDDDAARRVPVVLEVIEGNSMALIEHLYVVIMTKAASFFVIDSLLNSTNESPRHQ